MILAVVMDATLDKAAKLAKIEAYLNASEPEGAADPAATASGADPAEPPAPMSEQKIAKIVGDLVEQKLREHDSARADLVEQEVQRRLAGNKYVKPATGSTAPPPGAGGQKKIPTDDPKKTAGWLRG